MRTGWSAAIFVTRIKSTPLPPSLHDTTHLDLRYTPSPPPPPVPHHETKIKNLRWTWKLNCSSPLRIKKPNKNALRPQESFFSSQWPFRVRQPHPGGTAATPRHEADQFSRPSMCRWDRSRVNFFSLLFLIFSLFDKEVHLFIYVTSRI